MTRRDRERWEGKGRNGKGKEGKGKRGSGMGERE